MQSIQYYNSTNKLRDDLAAARAVLKKHSTMLLTASKVYVRHPELAAAKANRDYVLKQVCEAVNTINDVAQGRVTQPSSCPYDGPGELAAALDEFDDHMAMEPLAYNEVHTRPSLEERLESIISGAALMADSSCTRDERRERIVAQTKWEDSYVDNVDVYFQQYGATCHTSNETIAILQKNFFDRVISRKKVIATGLQDLVI
ncbi:catenin alpha-like isoform X2 [Harmonia axyridis]|uniref:catenin alpha-like isoform X1 n=1 Tax=Harmonia axyridis TaxID=115357 RepID=UPI001E27516F|nr:catenin alpha-like isoform X1 [Harmonia axyridis]XP_045480773.1 catenin alpha-like isoform X2 [Harmonia axyridis]